MASQGKDMANRAGDSEKDLPFRPRGSSIKKEASGTSKETLTPESPKSPEASKTPNAQQKDNKSDKSKDQQQQPGPKMAASNSNGVSALPAFIIKRNKLFDELKHKRDAEILEKEHPVINVVLDLGPDPEGKQRPAMPVAAKAWESTPGSFLRHVDKDVSSDVVIAKVDGKELWDLDRPLEWDCRVSYLPFTSSEGRNVFWHSSAHVLGEAAECQYQCLLSHGPPVEQGFFYDMALKNG